MILLPEAVVTQNQSNISDLAVSKRPPTAALNRRQKSAKGLPPFDKYRYYLESVQSPIEDMKFLDKVYRDVHGKKARARVMREDFCGTFANCKAWVEMASDKVAHGVDLDPEPLAWGMSEHFEKLAPEARKRLEIHRKDVMGKDLPRADVICGMNFSYFIFKQRETLKAYFKNCLRTLNDGGVLVLDCFGGSKCYEPIEEETTFDTPRFSYFWDQVSFDPLTANALFHIHFKRPGEAKRLKQFTYDWRMWTVPELKDLLLECGFANVNLYWEGVEEDGSGDGDFQIVDKGDDCESWIAYIAAVK